MYKFVLLILFIKFLCAQNTIKLLFITDETQLDVSDYTGKILKELEDITHQRLKFDDQFLTLSNNPNENDQKFCSIIANGVNMVIDLSVSEFYGNTVMTKIIAFRLPYTKLDISINAFVEAFDQYMMKRNATDAALIFSTSADLEQAVSFLIGNSILRIIVLDGNDSNSLKRLADIRPSPSYYAIFADTIEQMINAYDTAQKYNLIYRFDRWNLVFLDFNYEEFINKKIENDELNVSISIIYPKAATACYVQMRELPCDIPNNFNLIEELLRSFLKLLTNIILKDEDKYNLLTIDCNSDNITYDNETEMFFHSAIADEIGSTNDKFYFDEVNSIIRLKYEIGIKVLNDSYELTSIAQWTKNEGITVDSNQEIIPTKAFYRIGTAEAIPWSFPERDPNTGEAILDENGKPKWTGYCLDLIDLLSQEMNFDYELVIPENGTFGKRIGSDKWDGLIGDLKTGKTDIAVAALTMTAEREEVIDFVAPYFEQTGILVVMRKPVRQTSMFKFMTVLKMEVWLSILAALIVTAVLLWILDTFSPYSARNNKKAYPYPCREFTLKESFWFALTSFTPQGGGEAPKSVSGRTLVAAYWLFVVLMLATFTANLAAFLTVERMQTPVQSMEQLARQSRINYTVMEGSPTHEYFTNMKFAEETLYRLWKELTLNATSDQSQYRVWDYPIKEQYGHILSAIQETGTVENETIGFQKVLDHDEADFAFIHDSSRIKYEVSRNCNLTTIGELFAEQPFAIAVQQGSHLQEEISKVLLDMQKNRVFEHLTNKYWNYSARGVCSDDSDSEGISLESLGGVFIATLFGLALAMITLAVEVIYYKRKEKLEVRAILEDNKKPKAPKSPKIVTIGTTFKPVTDKIPRVSHISVFPRHNFNP